MLKLAYEYGAIRALLYKRAADTSVSDVGDVATPLTAALTPFPISAVVSGMTAPEGKGWETGLKTGIGDLGGHVVGAAGGAALGGAAGAGIGALVQYLRGKNQRAIRQGATRGALTGGTIGLAGGMYAGSTLGAHAGRQWAME